MCPWLRRRRLSLRICSLLTSALRSPWSMTDWVLKLGCCELTEFTGIIFKISGLASDRRLPLPDRLLCLNSHPYGTLATPATQSTGSERRFPRTQWYFESANGDRIENRRVRSRC